MNASFDGGKWSRIHWLNLRSLLPVVSCFVLFMCVVNRLDVCFKLPALFIEHLHVLDVVSLVAELQRGAHCWHVDAIN